MTKVSRTPLTWLMYAVNGVAAFFVYSVGPATPLIAEDLDLNPTIAALHGTAMAAAMLTAGFVTAPLVKRFGRPKILLAVSLLMAFGVALVALAPMLLVSLSGAYVAGTAGAIMAVAANATLADEDPVAAPTLLTEANAAAAWTGLFAPLFMGIFLIIGLGWRWGLASAIPMCLILGFALYRFSAAESEVEHRHDGQPARQPVAPTTGYPPIFWFVLMAVFAAAGFEFAVNYWGASLMLEQVSDDKGTVTAVMSAAVAGLALGRTFGGRVAAKIGSHRALLSGFAIATVGFAVFWLAPVLAVGGLGLFVIGLGLSVLYPLLLDRAVSCIPDRSDRAISWAVGFAGAAIGLAPFGLGAIAGNVGVSTAFLIVPVIAVLGFVGVLMSGPARR